LEGLNIKRVGAIFIALLGVILTITNWNLSFFTHITFNSFCLQLYRLYCTFISFCHMGAAPKWLFKLHYPE